MEYLQSLIDNSNVPLITAFLLGLLTAVSPCPLATNITAIGFIGKDIESHHRIFVNGLLYALGRVLAYTALGFILIPILREGASMFAVQEVVAKYGEMLLAPALIVVGVYMLGVFRLKLPMLNVGSDKLKQRSRGAWGALLLGVLFALAFCPTSGVFYFGMLIPMSAAESGGYLLPVVYAIATGLPVIIVAWILAYSVARLGKFYNRMQVFERWFRKVVAVLFIGVGVYYGYITYF